MKFSTLLYSQFQQERRSGEQLILGLTFAVILGALTFLTLGSAYLDGFTIQKLVPSLYWILYLFAATITVGRSFEGDTEFRAIDAIRVSLRGKEEFYFFAKYIFTNILVLCIGLMLLGTLYLFSPSRLPADIFSALFLVILLVTPSYSTLAVVISALLAQHRLRAVLLPCLLFPLLTPVLFAAVELTFTTANHEALFTSSPWFWLLALTATAYPLLGSLLFSNSLEE